MKIRYIIYGLFFAGLIIVFCKSTGSTREERALKEMEVQEVAFQEIPSGILNKKDYSSYGWSGKAFEATGITAVVRPSGRDRYESKLVMRSVRLVLNADGTFTKTTVDTDIASPNAEASPYSEKKISSGLYEVTSSSQSYYQDLFGEGTDIRFVYKDSSTVLTSSFSWNGESLYFSDPSITGLTPASCAMNGNVSSILYISQSPRQGEYSYIEGKNLPPYAQNLYSPTVDSHEYSLCSLIMREAT